MATGLQRDGVAGPLGLDAAARSPRRAARAARGRWACSPPPAAGVAEQRHRRPLELDGDLGDAPRQPLAGAQVERHALPAPVVDEQLERRVGLGVGVRRDPLLAAVGRHVLPVHPALDVLRRAPPNRRRDCGGIGRTARSTFIFSSRTASASKAAGGSMATSENSWMRWGLIMSRSAPASS